MAGPSEIAVTRRIVDIGATVPELAGHTVAADVFAPTGHVRPVVFCCLPGGGMSRQYWDLRTTDDDSYSFARWMTERGYSVITLDHLGTGESTLPAGAAPPLLRQVIAANDAAFRTLADELSPRLIRVGVGHSMGATLTVRQQAVHDTYNSVCLLGFSTNGLPAAVPPDITAALDGPPDDGRLADLTLRMFRSAYPRVPAASPSDIDDEQATAPIRNTVAAAATQLLGAGGMLSLLPGNVAADALHVRVPVLVLNGEHDPLINGSETEAERYPHAATFAEHVLPDAGHNHNVAATRTLFWESLRDWAERL